MEKDTKLQQLFQLLRWCGAAMIVTAGGTFLVQSWDQTGDVKRYLALLGTTALLPIVGYVCGIRFQEGRSARVLVLTFLALLPIHAGLLGGFVLSQFGGETAALAPVAQWVAPSKTSAVLLVAGAAVLLIPMTWASFRVLFRRHSGLLTASSAASQALLLIPDRSPLAATIALVPIFTLTGWCVARTKPETREAKLAVWSLLTPAAIIAARQVLFYDVSSGFWAVASAAGAIALFALGRKSEDATVERVALVPTLVGAGALMVDVAPALDLTIASSWLGYGFVSGAALLTFAFFSQHSKRFFVLSALMVNAVAPATLLFVEASAWAALQLIAIGLLFCSYGFISNRHGALYSGVGLAGAGFIVEVRHAINAFEASGWLALGAFGVVLVGLTAWLERRARAVRLADPGAKVSQEAPVVLP
jgi:hypothetical protein